MTETAPRITRTRDIPPDSSIARAVGRHHTFETAIADLVDNSIDAGATIVEISVCRKGERSFVSVADDGRGMTERVLEEAMRYGSRRSYGGRDLGKFGLGLKTASLSQCRRLTVATKTSPKS